MKIYKKKGFTLVEALVALGIFSIVVVSASGVILSIISSNKKNQAISAVVNNLNYSIESMIRDIKTGYKYQCMGFLDLSKDETLPDDFKMMPPSCTDTFTNKISLISTITGKEVVVSYELKNPGTEDAYIIKTYGELSEDGTQVLSFEYPITDSKNVKITDLSFFVKTPHPLIPTPTGAEVLGQPSVFLTVKGTAKVNEINVSDFFIQTYISQRLPNFI